MISDSPRVLSVGQCGVDGPWIKRVFQNRLGAVVEEANLPSEALAKARHTHYQLILINRELARDYSSGLDLIPDLLAIQPETPVMIVSNYDDAQESAIERGAARGFGKNDLESPETLDRLKAVLQPTT